MTITTFQQGLFPTDTADGGAPAFNVGGARNFRHNRNLFIQTATATIANSTSETTLLSTGIGSKTLPANWWAVGRKLVLEASGHLSTHSSPGSLLFRFKLGSTTIAANSALTPTASLSSVHWFVRVTLTCRSIGASGTVMCQVKIEFYNSTSASASLTLIPAVQTATDTIDTTASMAVDLTFQWGGANAANTISCTNADLWYEEVVA